MIASQENQPSLEARKVKSKQRVGPHHAPNDELYVPSSRSRPADFVEGCAKFAILVTGATVAVAAVIIFRGIQSLLGAAPVGRSRRLEPDMTLKILDLPRLLEESSFVPQAIVAGDVEDLSRRLQIKLEHNVDDFDEYVGAAFLFDKTPVAVMRYAGHPKDQYTIYLPFKVAGIDRITRMVHEIASTLRVPEKSIVWERRDNPDL